MINMVVNVTLGNITLKLEPNKTQEVEIDGIKVEVGFKLKISNSYNYDGLLIEKKLWFTVSAEGGIEIEDVIREVGEFYVWNTTDPKAVEEFINNFEKEKVWRFEERLDIAIEMAKIAKKYLD